MREVLNLIDREKYEFTFICSDRGDVAIERLLDWCERVPGLAGAAVHRLPTPKSHGQSKVRAVITAVYAFAVSMRLLVKVAPNIVGHNQWARHRSATVLRCSRAKRELSAFGETMARKALVATNIKLLYLESLCRVEDISRTGRMLYYFVDTFVALLSVGSPFSSTKVYEPSVDLRAFFPFFPFLVLRLVDSSTSAAEVKASASTDFSSEVAAASVASESVLDAVSTPLPDVSVLPPSLVTSLSVSSPATGESPLPSPLGDDSSALWDSSFTVESAPSLDSLSAAVAPSASAAPATSEEAFKESEEESVDSDAAALVPSDVGVSGLDAPESVSAVEEFGCSVDSSTDTADAAVKGDPFAELPL
ncbi:UDP-N-acetylglucosamine transferase subunit ALG14 homolog [Babesia caballi]|uniref:UDP-N-acetylglucosamine transferase subunit ALG14 n=1 Tax=Babesia caballi TaxID=5871 RepID=A0AAV4M363_BABCB|nr:UDP-N-acetylglucosamine transferase subunit ALG14 homolog [Babesia caballi]